MCAFCTSPRFRNNLSCLSDHYCHLVATPGIVVPPLRSFPPCLLPTYAHPQVLKEPYICMALRRGACAHSCNLTSSMLNPTIPFLTVHTQTHTRKLATQLFTMESTLDNKLCNFSQSNTHLTTMEPTFYTHAGSRQPAQLIAPKPGPDNNLPNICTQTRTRQQPAQHLHPNIGLTTTCPTFYAQTSIPNYVPNFSH